MWTRVSQVAENRRLPADKLVEFAVKNESKYGIIDFEEGKEPMVNTWYCDDLVRDFRKAFLG